MSKPTSCGVIITDGKNILLGHSTGNKHWDIPKGQMDAGESYREAALRELHEETGIFLTDDDVVEIGVMDYTLRKNLYLCYYKTPTLPDIDTIVCTSMCEVKGRVFPELDKFEYVPFSYIRTYTTENMANTIGNVLTSHKDIVE